MRYGVMDSGINLSGGRCLSEMPFSLGLDCSSLVAKQIVHFVSEELL